MKKRIVTNEQLTEGYVIAVRKSPGSVPVLIRGSYKIIEHLNDGTTLVKEPCAKDFKDKEVIDPR